MIILLYITIGAVISCLLNYLADVLPQTRRFSRPICQICGHKFSAWEYLCSFKCPECKHRPGLRYWLVLSICVISSVLLAFFPLKTLGYWASLPLFTFLGLIFIIDVEHKAVLFETDIIGLIIGIIYGLLLHKPLDVLFGGLFGAGIMLLFYYGGIFFNRILSKARNQEISEVALGFGDVIVCGYLGLIAGWPYAIGMVITAILLGGIFSLGYLIFKTITRKYSAFSAIPYVPFLIIGLIFILLLNFVVS